MRSMTFTTFRQSASQVLDLVVEGESVRILRHGKAIAVILPIDLWLGGDGAPQPAWKRPGPRLDLLGTTLSGAVLDARRQRP
ncbi:MAG: type II toxin-antitoxin system Phd/YefM family antitoxin [Ardenticatenia bacterium]|jgi:prevent-host-death family protein|nr:type II toxin-antitoxin system Phd/YefM family antitoxin [Ardenticatenia bacterium]